MQKLFNLKCNMKVKSKVISTQKKRSMKTDYQDNEEIIDATELKHRNGITGDKTYHFIAYIRSFHEDNLFRESVKNLTGLARYIAQEGKFYTCTHNGYRLMKFSSISSDIHYLNREIMQVMEKERIEKERYNKQYKSK